MPEYTEADRKAFRLKDILNTRMSSLKAASVNNEGTSKTAEQILKEAEEYYNWLHQDQLDPRSSAQTSSRSFAQDQAENNIAQNEEKKKSPSKKLATPCIQGSIKDNIPAPNPQQAKILGLVAKRLQDDVNADEVVNYKRLCDYVFCKYNQYPANEKSVEKIYLEIEESASDSIIETNNFVPDN